MGASLDRRKVVASPSPAPYAFLHPAFIAHSTGAYHPDGRVSLYAHASDTLKTQPPSPSLPHSAPAMQCTTYSGPSFWDVLFGSREDPDDSDEEAKARLAEQIDDSRNGHFRSFNADGSGNGPD